MRVTTTAATIVIAFCQGFAIADDDKTNAARAEMYCVRDHVASLDDGKMDPKHLAEIIVPMCHRIHEASEQAISPQEWNVTSADKLRGLEFMHTLAAVLWSRKYLSHGSP